MIGRSVTASPEQPTDRVTPERRANFAAGGEWRVEVGRELWGQPPPTPSDVGEVDAKMAKTRPGKLLIC